MRAVRTGIITIALVTVIGCLREPKYTVIEGEAHCLLDAVFDSTGQMFIVPVDDFIDLYDSTGTKYRALLTPETEYLSLDGATSRVNSTGILENEREYRFYVRPCLPEKIPDKAKESVIRVIRVVGYGRPAYPPDSSRFVDIYRIQQLSDTSLYVPTYEIDWEPPEETSR